MVSETQLTLPMQDGKPLRYDFEYRREGTCNLFILLQPLAGWRHVKVTAQRTKQDFAGCMKDLVEIHFPEAEKISVVLDNLNTHSPAAFYEAFLPEQAWQLTGGDLPAVAQHLSGGTKDYLGNRKPQCWKVRAACEGEGIP